MFRNNKEKIKFFAMSMYLDNEEQIENSFTKIYQTLQFIKGARILIATDSKSQTKTLHDIKNSTRSKNGGTHGNQSDV